MTPAGTGAALCAPLLDRLPIVGVSVSVGRARGAQSTIATSDPIAAQLEAVQFDLGEGPSVDVVRFGLRVLATDLTDPAATRMWPICTAAALEAGAAALFVFPLLFHAEVVGVVGMYDTVVHHVWPAELIAAAEVLIVATARPAILLAIELATTDDCSSAGVVELRRELHQAVGMLMVQLDCSMDDAIARLRAHAFARSRTVEAMARDVVTRTLTFTTDDDPLAPPK